MKSHTFKLMDSVTIPVTPELIAEFANMPGSITERAKDEKRSAYIRNRVENGLAVPFNWAKAQVEGESKWYRVNGQHSSAELEAMDGVRPEGLMAHVDSYSVPDHESLVQLFRQFDPRQSSRSPLDVTNAYASVVDDLADIDRKIIKLAAESIWWYRKNVANEDDIAVGDDRYGIVLETQYHEFIKWLSRLLSIKTPELKAANIIAAMWATYQVHPAMATEFWKQAVNLMPNGSEAKEPGEILDDWLMKIFQGVLDETTRQAYQGCIWAWNAYVDEKEITKISAPNFKVKGYLDPKYPASK